MSNNDVTALVREDLRAFAGYRSARSEAFDGRVWLNANESPWMSPADSAATVRRYPDPQPAALRERLASLYGCSPEQLLAGRGSDEVIDLLVRALCRPGQDAVVLTPPTFGMYAVCAKLHGTRAVEVPLVDAEDGFACDFDSLAEVALASEAKLVFLCSPGNPSGTALPLASIAELARRLQGRALVVVDEAYAEYSDAGSAVTQIDAQPNIAVLRTMSKAHALAGARVGCVIADGALIEVLQRCQAPYPLPEPSVAIALRALSDDGLVQTSSHIATTRGERDRLCRQLRASPGVRRVYPSQANFLLVRFDDPQGAFDRLLAAGIVVRDMRAALGLNDALRISLGTPEQNAAVIDVLARSREAA